MQEKINSEGKCLFCDKSFSKTSINRHLVSHLNEFKPTEKHGLSFLVKVETLKRRRGTTPYFLSLWIDGEAKFDDFDSFLRDIWLECCGHMSAFIYPAKRKPARGFFDFLNEGEDDEEFEGDISKKWKVKKVFAKDLVLEYEYDFGSTTALSITVVEQFPVKATEKIILLSRNEPLKIVCCSCGKAPATQLCSVCYDDAFFCGKCAKKHAKTCSDFADYASMPVVNSPRMGVCGYEGGVIDKERDGVFQM